MSVTLRLYLSLHITRFPLVAEVEFPESEAGRGLTELYRESIRISKAKSLDIDRQERNVVAFKLPSSVHDITHSRTHSSLVLHFNEAADAEKFRVRDPLFFVVPDHARQLYIKQSWTEREEASLKRTLKRQVREADRQHWEDRAGPSPVGDVSRTRD